MLKGTILLLELKVQNEMSDNYSLETQISSFRDKLVT